MIWYDPEFRLALSDEPQFPSEFPADEDLEGELPEGQVDLDEWREYFVRFYGDEPKEWVNQKFSVGQRFYGNVSRIRFENAAGLTRLGGLRIRVQNWKIGDQQFAGMLDYITDRYASLVADFGSPTGHAYEKSGAGSRELAYHEYLFLRRFFRERENDLESVVGAIVADPHRRLREEVVSCPVEQVAAPDPVLTVRALCAGEHLARLSPGHPLTRTPLGALLRAVAGESVYPARLPLRRRYHDSDTPENRFAKFVLEDLKERVRVLTEQLSRSRSYLNPDIEDVLVGLGRQSSVHWRIPSGGG